MNELIAKLETVTEGSRRLDWEIDDAITRGWPSDNPPPYTTDLNAAFSLCPERGECGLFYRIIVERKPIHSGPAWIAEVREHGKIGGDAVAHTAQLAVCAAALQVRALHPFQQPLKTALQVKGEQPPYSGKLP